MLHILKAEYVDGLQLRLQFSDGASGICGANVTFLSSDREVLEDC